MFENNRSGIKLILCFKFELLLFWQSNFILMKGIIFISISFFIQLIFNPVIAQNHIQNQQKSPKLVVGIMVENMRPDYIQRYWNRFRRYLPGFQPGRITDPKS